MSFSAGFFFYCLTLSAFSFISGETGVYRLGGHVVHGGRETSVIDSLLISRESSVYRDRPLPSCLQSLFGEKPVFTVMFVILFISQSQIP